MKKHTKTKEVLLEDGLQNLQQVLLKKALGYKIKETADEFVVLDDELKLTKRKVNVKYYPPDLNAIELLLNKNFAQEDVTQLTDEELEAEKQKLLNQLKLLQKKEETEEKE